MTAPRLVLALLLALILAVLFVARRGPATSAGAPQSDAGMGANPRTEKPPEDKSAPSLPSAPALPDTPRAIAGTVVEADGTGNRDGVVVSAWQVDADEKRAPGAATAAADAEGRFRMEALPPGEYRLTAVVRGARIGEIVRVPAERDLTGVALRVPEMPALTVTVVDALDVPVPGVEVATDTFDSGPRAWVGPLLSENRNECVPKGREDVPELPAGIAFTNHGRTDERGQVVFRASPAPRTVVVIDPADGEDSTFAAPPPATVPPGATEIRIRLQEAQTASGTLLLPDGQPAPEGLIVWARDGKRPVAHALTGPEGTFEVLVPLGAILSLTWDATFWDMMSLRLNDDGNARAARARLDGVRPNAHDLTLQMEIVPNTGSLVVRVEDADGKPIADAPVHFADSEEEDGAAGRTGPDGELKMEGLVALAGDLVAEPPRELRGGDLLCGVARDVIPDGRAVTIRLGRGRKLPVIVRMPDGSPAAGMGVYTTKGQMVWQEVTTDARGIAHVLLDPLLRPPFSVSASLDKETEWWHARLDSVPGSPDFVILALKHTRR